MEKLFGKSVYEGIVISDIYLQKKQERVDKNISIVSIQDEQEKFEHILNIAKNNLKILKESLKENNDLGMNVNIIDSHLSILCDPMFIQDIKKEIDKHIPLEISIEEITDKYVKLFEKIDNPIYRQRLLDIKDVSSRLLEILDEESFSLEELNDKILVLKELYPTQLLKIIKEKIRLRGIIMEYGGETSHVAILAKALKIPTLMGVPNIFKHAWDKKIILDTREDKSVAILEPTQEILDKYEIAREKFSKKLECIDKNANLESITKDGVKINLYLNIGGKNFRNYIEKWSVTGVGLLRTELIYMNSNDFPCEEKQLKIYEDLLKDFSKSQPIIIRTLDIGADKQLSYFSMKDEKNPFLGLRGLRFSLENIDIFKTQLKAILRLSASRNIKIMYPMVTNIEEVKRAHEILEEVKKELELKNIKFNKDIEVGIMVEVPSVIMMAEEFAKITDFMSVGSNDLTQYILATDRLSETIGYMYDSLNPSVLRAINILHNACIKYDKKVSICGEMAGDPKGMLALLSLGIKNFSMVESSIPMIKNIIRNINTKDLYKIKEKVLTETNLEVLKEYLKKEVERIIYEN